MKILKQWDDQTIYGFYNFYYKISHEYNINF